MLHHNEQRKLLGLHVPNLDSARNVGPVQVCNDGYSRKLYSNFLNSSWNGFRKQDASSDAHARFFQSLQDFRQKPTQDDSLWDDFFA